MKYRCWKRFTAGALSAAGALCALLAPAAVASAAEEAHPGILTEPLVVEASDGVRLHGVLTRPDDVERPPVIHFVQWLSCDTVLLEADRRDGWSLMLRQLVRDSGFAVARVDKRGVGGSGGGSCEDLDFETELADHRAVLRALEQRSDIDADHIVVFGASMGSRYAPLLAEGRESVAGVLVWGGGALTWFERMLGFDRHALELAGTEAAAVNRRMTEHVRFHSRYLLDGEDPPAIIADDPGLVPAWSRMIGTGGDHHYGRPFAFHQQAQQADWGAAWTRVAVPVLAVQGAYDWFESRAGGETIEHLAPAARFEVISGMDHHFTLFGSAEDAFAGTGGRADPEPFLAVALPWLRRIADEAAR